MIYSATENFNLTTLYEIGGKAYNLRKFGFLNSPKWFSLTVTFFDKWLGNKRDEIESLLGLTPTNLEKIKEIILGLSPTKEIEELVYSRIDSNRKYAVRSSAVDEDSSYHSFAGVMESFINVEKKDLFEKIKSCYLSAFSVRAMEYRRINNLPTTGIKMAVIIQEMVKPHFAGVINTINPITNNPDEYLVSVTRGYGENIVSGYDNSTDYFINGDNINVIGEDILSIANLHKLINLADEIMKESDTFQDIEFAIRDNTVYFLQTRAIATYSHINVREPRIVLDNANIIESYSGVTTPLTFSFAKEVYEKVYTETLEAGHVSQRIRDTLKPSLKEMLHFFDNRIYYNLNSWYHLTSIFPNRKKTTGYMERMMGVGTKLTKAETVRMNRRETLKFGLIFFHKLNRMNKLSEKFIRVFNEVVMPYLGRDFKGLKNNELVEIFSHIEENILNDFTTPIINDCGAMVYYGMLTKFVKGLKIADFEGLISYLVGKQGNVESAESADYFFQIIAKIKSNSEILADFIGLDAKTLLAKYHDESILTPFVKAYIRKFGPRVMDELKLETITLIEDPVYLYDMLKNFLINSINQESHERVKYSFKIPLYKRPYFHYLVKKTKYFIRNREKLRLKRTYIYSVVRNIFLRIGSNFFEEGLLVTPRDIFFLTKQEVFDYIKTNTLLDFKGIVEIRKEEYEKNKSKVTSNRIVIYKDQFLPVLSGDDVHGELKGIPSGAGVVSGKVKLVENPLDALIDNDIILALRTDPGWIPLFPLCKGIIVERGSILSHSAVVAREMGIPAVVGVKNATKRIPDKAYVRLDGIKGEVEILDEVL